MSAEEAWLHRPHAIEGGSRPADKAATWLEPYLWLGEAGLRGCEPCGCGCGRCELDRVTHDLVRVMPSNRTRHDIADLGLRIAD